MKSRLTAIAYTDKNWFDDEQRLLFRKLWQFAAPRMLLNAHNAYVRRQLAGIDVVIQNIDGQICAFENVCAHRKSTIQCEPQGVRPLVCPYHAWRYDAQGAVAHIPVHDECYRFAEEERSNLRLRRFTVHEFGQLVFVHLGERPLPFEEQFDLKGLDALRQASELFDNEVLVTCMTGNFNWKLAYENLRDGLHPQFLHARSLYRQVKFKAHIDENDFRQVQVYRNAVQTSYQEHLGWLRKFSGGGPNEPIQDRRHYVWHDYVNRYGQEDRYLDWLLYPNLHIASGSAGYSFIVEHHVPMSANRTDLWVYYLTGRKKRKYPTSAAVLLAHLQGAEKVLLEDINVMERVQESLMRSEAPTKSNVGDFEYANMAIERWYLDVMESRHAL